MSKRSEATRAGSISVILHASAIALLRLLSAMKPVQMKIREVTPLFAPLPVQHVNLAEHGGGGGARQPLVRKGDPPKTVARAFILPAPVARETQVASPVISGDMPQVSSAIGSPDGLAGLMGGPGIGGIGGPGRGGFGPGPGPGSGDGDDSGGVLRAGGGVSAPKAIYTPEPEYSDEARQAKLEGTVLLSMVVDQNGRTTKIRVIHSLGLGLDQKAIDAVRRWTFVPGKKDGKPVAVEASAVVSFRLL